MRFELWRRSPLLALAMLLVGDMMFSSMAAFLSFINKGSPPPCMHHCHISNPCTRFSFSSKSPLCVLNGIAGLYTRAWQGSCHASAPLMPCIKDSSRFHPDVVLLTRSVLCQRSVLLALAMPLISNITFSNTPAFLSLTSRGYPAILHAPSPHQCQLDQGL